GIPFDPFLFSQEENKKGSKGIPSKGETKKKSLEPSSLSQPAREGEMAEEVAEDIASISFHMVIITLFAMGFVLEYLGPLLKPFFIALILYFLIHPITKWLSTYGIPKPLSYVVLVLLFLASILVLGFWVYKNVEFFKERFPYYQSRFSDLVDQIAHKTGYANPNGHFDWETYTLEPIVSVPAEKITTYIFGTLYDFLSGLVVVLLYLIFIILEAGQIPRRIEKAFLKKKARELIRIHQNIHQGIQKYIVVKTIISLGTGFTAALILYGFHQDFWLLWGILTFLFNFIPYIGSLIVSIFPIILAFLTSGFWIGGTIAILLIGNQFFWGNFLEPQMSGKHLDISPLVLLFMVAYWGWIWGVTGMILSVPFTVAIKIILENFEKTKPIAILLSND
ncbi:MAG: AI-2E family transporter, partial [Planctomycetota bacterium]